ncbi:hypothetical protein [Cryobacterium mannosilyticum]|uniref:Uncharacterized protein n=1 Tax=Cryobacterium mannosilyticum TaxID=1259190 RepID=A0A4R8WIX9_9MICO|nr:hypothetical protein [Cryobacterium mannosilyticum]TFC07493.1 hypothetical protein E3O32_03035 [Cryobacterium mannosilyticum]
MSTHTSTSTARLPVFHGKETSRPAGRAGRLEPLVDAILRQLWQLVGAYVWLVLLAKGERPARAVCGAGHGT